MDIEYLKEKYPDWIISVYKTGSSMLPWIDYPRDTDYVIFVTTTSDERITQLFAERPKNECWIVADKNRLQNPHIYSYERHFEQLMYGEEVACEGYDIFDNQLEYKKYITNYALKKPYDTRFKHWYHVLTAIYLLDNGGYFVTDEQKANIKLCHDKQMTPEIYDYIQNRLLEYAENINDSKEEI